MPSLHPLAFHYPCLPLNLRSRSRNPPQRRPSTSSSAAHPLNVQFIKRVPNPRHTSIFIHDFLTDSSLFRLLAPHIPDDIQLVALDLRGHGKSPIPTLPYIHAQDIYDVSSKFPDVHLVAVGLGGIHSLEALLKYPQSFRSLALLGSGLSGYKWSRQSYIQLQQDDADENPVANFIKNSQSWKDTLENSSRETITLLKNMVKDYSGFHFNSMDPEQRFSNDPLTIRLCDVQGQVLVAVGQGDSHDFHQIAKQIHRGIPNARGEEPIVVEDSGHFITLEKPKEISELLVQFWNTL